MSITPNDYLKPALTAPPVPCLLKNWTALVMPSAKLRAAPWRAPKPREIGVRVFDVIHDLLVAENAASTEAGSMAGDRTPSRPVKLKSA